MRVNMSTLSATCDGAAGDGKTYAFNIRDGVNSHDGSDLTAYDVTKSWPEIVREFKIRVLDTQAPMFMMPPWERIVPMRSYVKGWKIGPSAYLNEDVATVWLDK